MRAYSEDAREGDCLVAKCLGLSSLLVCRLQFAVFSLKKKVWEVRKQSEAVWESSKCLGRLKTLRNRLTDAPGPIWERFENAEKWSGIWKSSKMISGKAPKRSETVSEGSKRSEMVWERFENAQKRSAGSNIQKPLGGLQKKRLETAWERFERTSGRGVPPNTPDRADSTNKVSGEQVSGGGFPDEPGKR